jgi:hypothetical protein
VVGIIGDRSGDCNPWVAVYDYLDVVGFWLPEPATRGELRAISDHVTCPLVDRPYVLNGRPKFNPNLNQRQRWHQPQPPILLDLAAKEDAYVNYVEIARDVILDDEEEAREACEFFSRSLVQLRHCPKRKTRKRKRQRRKRPRVRRVPSLYENGNGSTGSKYNGFVFAWYGTRSSKVSGEVHCLHFEARLFGHAKLAYYGIGNATDLFELDHNAFWQRVWKNHLAFYIHDAERLGRSYLNKLEGKRRRKPLVLGLFNYNRDKAVGSALFRALGSVAGAAFSPQGVLNYLGVTALDRQGLVWRPFIKPPQPPIRIPNAALKVIRALATAETDARSYPDIHALRRDRLREKKRKAKCQNEYQMHER